MVNFEVLFNNGRSYKGKGDVENKEEVAYARDEIIDIYKTGGSGYLTLGDIIINVKETSYIKLEYVED